MKFGADMVKQITTYSWLMM